MFGQSPDPVMLSNELLQQVQNANPNAVSQIEACNSLNGSAYQACVRSALANNPLNIYSSGPSASGPFTSSNVVGNWFQGTTLGLPNLIIFGVGAVVAWYLFKKLEHGKI